MKHDYKKLNAVLLAALENIPEEKSISLRELIESCFSDYKYFSAGYSEELKKYQNPYTFFNGEKWKHLELIDFTGDFFETARMNGFFLDDTKFTGGCFGTPENLEFFVRREPISESILFQVKEYPAGKKSKGGTAEQLKVYFDGAVKCETIEKTRMIHEYETDAKTGEKKEIVKPLEKKFGGTYFVNKQVVEKIKDIYKENADEIKALPQNIEKEISNEYFQEFTFGTKKITCLNIHDSSEEEKAILRIFTDIRNVIDSSTPEDEWNVRWDEFNFLQ